MRRRIDELNLQSSLTLLGRRDDVPELMQISSLLLLTSSFEGMPNVVMEAQAMGIPVVAPNVGGVSDGMLDGQTGYLVESTTLVALPGAAWNCSNMMICAAGLALMVPRICVNSFSRRAMAQRYLDVLEHGVEIEENALVPIQATAA